MGYQPPPPPRLGLYDARPRGRFSRPTPRAERVVPRFAIIASIIGVALLLVLVVVPALVGYFGPVRLALE